MCRAKSESGRRCRNAAREVAVLLGAQENAATVEVLRSTPYLSQGDTDKFEGLLRQWEESCPEGLPPDGECRLYAALWPTLFPAGNWFPSSPSPEQRVNYDAFTRWSNWQQARNRQANERRARQQARRDAAARERSAALLAEAESTGRECWLRFGSVPDTGVSYNHAESRPEAGVSVYRGWVLPDNRVTLDLREVDRVSALFIIQSGEPLHEVKGTPLTITGSDGEPLLVGASARRLEPVAIQSVRQ